MTEHDRPGGVFPEITEIARMVRAFLGRAVRCLAGDAEIRQFLDIGDRATTDANIAAQRTGTPRRPYRSAPVPANRSVGRKP